MVRVGWEEGDKEFIKNIERVGEGMNRPPKTDGNSQQISLLEPQRCTATHSHPMVG